MKVGLAYDLKDEITLHPEHAEDALEEYDSPETVAAIAKALESLGHSVVRLGGGREFLTHILQDNVDFVFNIAEGRGVYRSREAQVPSVLEMLGIPYSGSDPECLALCLDKPLTKRVLQAAGVATPRWQVITDGRQLEELAWNNFPLPGFVKPAYEGSSKGIRFASRVETMEHICRMTSMLLEQYQQPVMIEEFISGEEVTIGVVGSPPQVLGIMRVVPKRGGNPNFTYSLEVKREWEDVVSYECPAKLSVKTTEEIIWASLTAFEVLGCRDVARIDFRVDLEKKPWLLEVNPLPGLRPGYSDLPMMAERVGYSYDALIGLIMDSALKRQRPCLARLA
ncbi:MAG: ATP-grasp domain-containing protein [Chloroflexi bacterium]|nr:ATP-grasp domain-containing protein [Chloroflexota bacterium]